MGYELTNLMNSLPSTMIFHPASHLPYFLAGDRPNLLKLLRFPDKKGNYINIPRQIGTKYFPFGLLLLNDETGAEVSTVISEHRENAEQINLKILSLWIGGRGKPLSWAVLIAVLKAIGLSTLASDVDDGLH